MRQPCSRAFGACASAYFAVNSLQAKRYRRSGRLRAYRTLNPPARCRKLPPCL